MSTSLLYHAFGISGYHYHRTKYEGGSIIFCIRKPDLSLKCPVCGAQDVIKKGSAVRRMRSVPIGNKAVFIECRIPRVACYQCRLVRQVQVEFADPRRTYTNAFKRYALELSKRATIRDVARHLGVSWDVIKEIQKTDLSKRFQKISLSKIRQIAIDEICIGKGHRYLTIVIDLATCAVIHIGEGKGAGALEAFWNRVKRCRVTFDAIAVDMSPAYTGAIIDNMPESKIVYDRFHIMKLYNEGLSTLRRDLQREYKNLPESQVLKVTRWLLLKNPENLDQQPERNEKQRLDKALKINEPLAKAYYLKDSLREFWCQSNLENASAHIHQWIEDAMATKIVPIMKFAKTMKGHLFGLLNWYKHPISTGPLEGTNNKIKTLQRKAYGFTDREFFKLKIYTLNEARYALVA